MNVLDGKSVVAASTSGEHTLLCTDVGELFFFGNHRCGISDAGYVVSAFVGKKVVGASVDEFHSLVWTETGELYSFGGGDDGQLGKGCFLDDEAQPTDNTSGRVRAGR